MKYEVTHTTSYSYGEPVPLCHNVVHLQPRDTSRQSCEACELTVLPDPTHRRDGRDFFGNHVTWIGIQEPHQSLKIKSRSLIEVQPFEVPPGSPSVPWDQVPPMLAARHDAVALDARQFCFESPYIPTNPELAAYARETFTPGRPLVEAAVELTDRIFHDFIFDSSATNVGTPVMDVLRNKRGVCQDFAHLQIGCFRSLGLPARYVSGYLMTKPPPGRPRVIGADVSHAWLSVFVPELGWLDLDPTNGVVPSDGHITVGWARDYDDISPVKGVITGGRRHSLSVSVHVEPIGEIAEAEPSAEASAEPAFGVKP